MFNPAAQRVGVHKCDLKICDSDSVSQQKSLLKSLPLGIKCFQGLDRRMDSLKNIQSSAAVIDSSALVKDCAQCKVKDIFFCFQTAYISTSAVLKGKQFPNTIN